jgi:hypothetical protein
MVVIISVIGAAVCDLIAALRAEVLRRGRGSARDL